MKKKLLPITLLAMLSLVACGGQTTETQTNEPTTQTETGPKEVTTLTITNREALTAEWHAEGADREVEFTTDFPINAGAEIGAGNLVVTSSDTKVIVANGTFISAIAEGKATVTVTYKGTISDSVEITVQAPLGAPDMKKSTIAELKAGDDKTGKFSYFIDYNVRGFKDYKSPEKYGNLFVDDTGTKDKADDLLIYGSTATASALTYDTAKRQYSFANPKDFIENEFTKNIKVGDTLNTVTIRSDYKDKMEGMSIIRGINGKYHANSVMTVKEIMELPEIQKDFAVQVTGKIKGLKDDNGTEYGNVYLTDLEDETKEMQVYGLTESTDALKVDGEKGNLYFKNPKNFLTGEATKALKPGDVITVTGVLGAFKGKNQISGYLNAPTLSFDKGQYGLEVGKELTLEAKLKYAEGEIKYTSANPEIATVEETTGKVKAIAEGFAEITATCGTITGKTKIHSYVAKERPAPTEKALADVLADTTGNKKVAFATQVKVAEFAGRDGVIEAATEFGGMNVTGLDGQNKVYVDGSSATPTAISFSAEWGDYSFSNPKDFLTNEHTKTIKVGDTLDVIALRNDYKENKQLLVVITAINGTSCAPVVPEKEPEVIKNATFDVILDKDGVNLGQRFTTTVKVKAFADDKGHASDAAQAYGALKVTTLTGDKEMYIKGSSATAPYAWDDTEKTYKYTAPTDFLTNELTKTIKLGYELDVEVVRNDFINEDNTYRSVQVVAKIIAVREAEPLGAPKHEAGIENGIKIVPEYFSRSYDAQEFFVGDVNIKTVNVGNFDKMQFKKNSGVLYNSTATTKAIAKIVVEYKTADSLSVTVGFGEATLESSKTGAAGTREAAVETFTPTGNATFFKLFAASKATNIASITVYYVA